MGCWNQTCGLTGLPIYGGAEVLVFALEKNPFDNERCHTTAFWKPVWVPFYSVYNDYGGGEGSTGVGFELLMKGLKSKLVEMKLGSNPYHDIAVTRDAMCEELFFDAIHESRLYISNWQKKKTQVDCVMFRKDVVDEILANFRQDRYVGEGNGTHGHNNSYIEFGFADILNDAPLLIEKFKKQYEEHVGFEPTKFILRTVRNHSSTNKAEWYTRDGDLYRYSELIDPFEELANYVENNDINCATELLEAWLTMSYLDVFMNWTRKHWTPMSHSGSQFAESHGYRVLAKAINDVLDREDDENND